MASRPSRPSIIPAGEHEHRLPALYLHPSHVKLQQPGSQQEIASVSGKNLQEELGPSSKLEGNPDAALCKARLDTLPWVGVADGELVTVWPDCDMAACRMQLLFREVALCFNQRFGLPLITLASGIAGQAWLLLVDGDMAAGRQVLALMAELGAIRLDFSELYSIERTSLGKGSNAAVFGVTEKHPGGGSTCGNVVAKVPLRGCDDDSGEVPEEMCHEVRMLTAVQGHPNVVKFYGLFYSAQNSGKDVGSARWAMLMERCNSGDVFDNLTRGEFSEHQARQIIQGLLSALAHTHHHQIVHRDVKPENMLIANDGRALLADYGIACHLRDFQQMDRRCGSPGYAAPEIIRGKCYGAKVDCFSAGALLYFILTSKAPFDGPTSASMLQRTVHQEVDFSSSPRFQHISESCKDLIVQLLMKNPTLRLNAADALEHPFLSQEGGAGVGKLAADSLRDFTIRNNQSHERRDAHVRAGTASGAPAPADPQPQPRGGSKTRTSAMQHLFRFRDPAVRPDNRAFSNLPHLWSAALGRGSGTFSARSQAGSDQGPEHRKTLDERVLNGRANALSDDGSTNGDADDGSSATSGYLSKGMKWLRGSKAKPAESNYRSTASDDVAGEATSGTARSSKSEERASEASGAPGASSIGRSPKSGSWMASWALGSSSSSSAACKRMPWRKDTGGSSASGATASTSASSGQARSSPSRGRTSFVDEAVPIIPEEGDARAARRRGPSLRPDSFQEIGSVTGEDGEGDADPGDLIFPVVERSAAGDAPRGDAPLVPRPPPAPPAAQGARRPVGNSRRLVVHSRDEEMSL